MIFVSF